MLAALEGVRSAEGDRRWSVHAPSLAAEDLVRVRVGVRVRVRVRVRARASARVRA